MTRLDVVAVTHRGAVRDRNEDTIAIGGFVSSAFEGEPIRFGLDSAAPIGCLVADGLGGHADGARASRLVAGFLADAWARYGDPESARSAVGAAQEALYAEMQAVPGSQGMGTTLAGVVFAGDQAICVNVGDSRCFRVSEDMLVQISIDDSPEPFGDLPAAPTHVVTQTLGGGVQRTSVDVHVHCDTVRPGDRFLLCSDGLTDYVPLETLEEHLRGPDPVATVRAMLASALDAGGGDNISVLLLRVAGATEAAADGATTADGAAA